jgi:hypothetical protein
LRAGGGVEAGAPSGVKKTEKEIASCGLQRNGAVESRCWREITVSRAHMDTRHCGGYVSGARHVDSRILPQKLWRVSKKNDDKSPAEKKDNIHKSEGIYA